MRSEQRQMKAIEALHSGRTTSEESMRLLVRSWVERDYGGSLTDAAKAWKISKAYLSDYLAGRRHLGPALQRAAGVERVIIYEYRRPDAD